MTTQIGFPGYRVPILDGNGTMSPVWYRYFSDLFARSGGSDSDSLTQVIERLTLLINTVNAGQVVQSDASVDVLRKMVESLQADQLAPVVPRRPDEQDIVVSHGIQADSALHAVATVTDNGFMSAADKTKLDGLAAVTSAALLVDVTAVNTTADTSVLSLALTGLVVGSTYRTRISGLLSNGAVASGLAVWMKLNGTKIFIQSFATPAVAGVNKGWHADVVFTVRSIGVAGSLQTTGTLINEYTAATASASGATTAINTTISNTFELGFNWGSAAVANTATAKNALIISER